MKVITLGTGSTGNCYFVKDDNGKMVILDCGLKFTDITHHPEFTSFSQVDFVFVSHQHSDHNKSLKDFKRTGCEIVSYETLQPKVEHWNIGNWECITFPLPHNVPNWGIVIKSRATGEKLCYMTDFTSAPKIECVDYFLYEVNYIEGYIDQMIDENKELNHLGFNNHNSLENAVVYFQSLKTRPKEIICCHLSASNSIRAKILDCMKQFADIVKIADSKKE